MASSNVDPKLPLTWKYFNVIAPVLRHLLQKRYGYDLAKRAYDGARPIYRDYIDRAPRIGAGNPMANNLYMSDVFFAFYTAADSDITPDMMRAVVRDLFDLAKKPLVKKAIDRSEGFRSADYRKKLTAQLHANKDWADARPAITDATWDFNFDDDRSGEAVAYHFTRCPINDFCRQEGLMDILPVMCEVDHLMMRLGHGRLTRNHTLAQDGPCCDYFIEPED